MNMFSGIIFADSYNSVSNELVNKRTLSSIPFGGRFRIIDFMLSSFVNAGIANVAIIPKRNYASLSDHLGGGKYWDLDHRNSGLKILSPFYRSEGSNEVFQARGKLDALRSVKPYFRSIKEDYVVISNGNLIANIDFEKVFNQHIETGADITLVYSDMQTYSKKNLEITTDENGRVNEIVFSKGDGEKANVSLNVYVLKKDLLTQIIDYAEAHDLYSFDKYALINNTQNLRIIGYKHDEYAHIVHSVTDYYKTSMDLLDAETRNIIFNTNRPIMTRVKDSIPVLYQYNAKVSNSLIADGCKIDGTVKNSIIFRNVTIETGAVVENCIIMQNSVIKKDADIKCVILDKNVTVGEGKKLCGDKDYPFVLEKNSEI